MQTRASFILIFLFIMLSPMRVSSQIVTGAEQMDQYMPLLKGKRIGMVVNHTSVVGAKRVHLLDTLLRRDVRVVKAVETAYQRSQGICPRTWFPR
mgnify:CR=1 FL=1